MVLSGYPRPSLAGIGVPWVLIGDPPMCLDAQRRHQGKAPTSCGWCSREVMWSWTWSERCVVVNFLTTVGTENTYTPARLGALFKSSQSSPFVPSRIRSPTFLASDCVLNPFRCFVRRSAVLFFVSLFRSSPGPSGQFQIAHQSQCSFRFTRHHLCVSVVLTLVTSVSSDARRLCARQSA